MLPACHPRSRLSGSSRYRCPSTSHASIHSVRCSASAGQPRYKRDLLLDNVNDDAETTLRPYILSPLPDITDQQRSQSQALSDAAWVPDGGVLEPAVIEPLSGPCADFQASTYAEGCSPAQDGLYGRNWAPTGSVDDEQWLEGQTSHNQSLSQQARMPAQSVGLRGLPGQDPRQDPISSYTGEGASEITAADPTAQGLDPGITSNHMQAGFQYNSTSHQETPGTSAQASSGSWDEFGDTPGRRPGSQRPSPTVPSSAANSDARQRPQDASSSMDEPSWASRSTASDDPAFADSAGWDAGTDWGQGQIISDWDGYPASRGPSQAVNSTGPGWQDSPLGPMGQQQSGSSSSEAPGYEGPDATRFFADAGRQSAGGRAWDNGNVDEQASGASSSSAAGFVPSDITLLARMDANRLLPLLPNRQQASYYQPKTLSERIVLLTSSIGMSVVLSKAVIIAAPALLFPVWSPWVRATVQNIELYTRNFKCVGLWRAQVMSMQLTGNMFGNPFSNEPPMVSLLVGDPWFGGARTQLDFPYVPRSELIREGDAVELLVLGRDEEFVQFKVVREVYLPESGVWLADYPYLDRGAFIGISLEVERARQQQQQQQAEQAGGSTEYGAY